jgi:hypothetical protein
MLDDSAGWTFEASRRCPACKDTQPIRRRYESGQQPTAAENKAMAGGQPCKACHDTGKERRTFVTIAKLRAFLDGK